MPAEQNHRRRIIADLIALGGVTSQEQLRELLLAEGVDVAQATLSRDLRALGVVKGPAGYVLPDSLVPNVRVAEPMKECQRAVKSHLVEIDVAGAMAIVKTAPGHAQALAFSLDSARLPGVVGTLAGDDTIFMACRSPKQAEGVFRRVRAMAGID